MNLNRLRKIGRVDQVTIPIVFAFIVAAGIVALLFTWSTAHTDTISIERQKQLVSLVLDQRAAEMAHNQEGVTVFDASVVTSSGDSVARQNNRIELKEFLKDPEFLDYTMGVYMHDRYRHDETYIVDVDGKAHYAMQDGARAHPAVFENLRRVAEPLIAALRAKMRDPNAKLLDENSLTLGVSDLATVNGHPMTLSVKPIVSTTKEIFQAPGREFVHISVKRVDGALLTQLSEKYLLKGSRFSWTDDAGGNEASLPLLSPTTNHIVGYFIWQPFAPGSVVRRDIGPLLLFAMIFVAAVFWLLVKRIKGGTAKLLASEAQAKHLAFHDVLTGLPNRALFEDRLDHVLATARRSSAETIALLCLDLDRFKKVNDSLGHPAGDQLIRELAKRLNSVVRETDMVARLGGDEFAIVQTGVNSQNDIDALCERILAAVKLPFDVVGSQVFVGMSIGVARSGFHGFDRTELVRKADIALYHAKAEGRGRYELFAATLDASIQIRQSIEQDLRTALDRGEQLLVFYQPKYEATSKTITGVEALVRWQHPTKGFMCPTMFVPVAEETGLIERLGEWVLREACTAALRWPIRTVSVNVSAVQLRSPFFAGRVMNILRATGMAPSRLELEITETSFLESTEECAPSLKMLRAAGVRIALDDFGTGYSSFNHLRNLQVDRLKIDQSFTNSIHSSSEGGAIIQMIVDLAKSTGLQITAEGVETAEQSAYLCAAGCDELQGFLLSKPMDLQGMDALLGIDPAFRKQPAQLTRAA